MHVLDTNSCLQTTDYYVVVSQRFSGSYCVERESIQVHMNDMRIKEHAFKEDYHVLVMFPRVALHIFSPRIVALCLARGQQRRVGPSIVFISRVVRSC